MRRCVYTRILFLLLGGLLLTAVAAPGFVGAAEPGAPTALPPRPTNLPQAEKPETPPRAPHGAAWFFRGLEIQGGSNLPASLGGGLILYFPAGIYLGNSFGVMPAIYIRLINKVLVASHEYEQATADLIEKALSNSFVYDLFLGWDPGKPGGFTFNAGYQLMTLGGRASTLGLVSQATGVKLGSELASMTKKTVPVKAVLHNLTARLGYKVVIFDHLTFDFYVGVLKTVAAQSDIQLASLGKNQSTVVAARLRLLDGAINSYMRKLYVHYIVSPLLIVNIGYRFW